MNQFYVWDSEKSSIQIGTKKILLNDIHGKNIPAKMA
jgi:hypothetical protein